mgnify:CR=1 FL=1
MLEPATSLSGLMLRAELLRGVGPLSVSTPQRDDKGRYWVFVSAAVGSELVSIPHVTAAEERDRPALMAAYRRTVAEELARRGFTVAMHAVVGEPIGRLM